jgi:hypothetical protein
MPILIGITVRNNWTNGKVERANGQFSEWTKQIAIAEHVAYIDLPDMAADRYEQMGEAAVAPLYNADKTHSLPAGAAVNAELVLSGLKALHRQNIIQLLSPSARVVNPATQPSVVLGRFSNGGSPVAAANFLNRAIPADPKLPSVILIGDSTVRNGRGDGNNGQWGWGDAISAYFDPNKANRQSRPGRHDVTLVYERRMGRRPATDQARRHRPHAVRHQQRRPAHRNRRGDSANRHPRRNRHAVGPYLRLVSSQIYFRHPRQTGDAADLHAGSAQ